MHQNPIPLTELMFFRKNGSQIQSNTKNLKAVVVFREVGILSEKICICHGVSRVSSRSVTHNPKVDPDKFWHIGSFNHYSCLDIQKNDICFLCLGHSRTGKSTISTVTAWSSFNPFSTRLPRTWAGWLYFYHTLFDACLIFSCFLVPI